MSNEDTTAVNMMIAVLSLYFASLTTGFNMLFIPDIGKAKISAAHLFGIIDSSDEDDEQILQNSKMITTKGEGKINFNHVTFKYKSRKEFTLNNLSLVVEKGNKAALVGDSGCGKSTIMKLLLRFYEPNSG